jgi:HSP20 family molecular chaperone IbpA
MHEKLRTLGDSIKDLLSDLTNQMDDALDVGGSFKSAKWISQVVTRKDHKITIRMELPGYKKENITVKVVDDVLIIEGNANRTEEVGELLASTIDSFDRKWKLSDNAIVDEIEADVRAGVLAVTVPLKCEKARSKDIPIG